MAAEDPSDPLTAIRNIGPALAAELARAGITTAAALRDMGADAAYRKLLAAGTRPHFIGYYVLHMALQGRPWNDCKGAEKDAMRTQFDAIKAEARSAGTVTDAAFERMMDEIGVGRRRRATEKAATDLRGGPKSPRIDCPQPTSSRPEKK